MDDGAYERDHRFLPKLSLGIDWERYYGGPERLPTERLHATIGPKRRILLNRNLFCLIGSPEEVVLYFNHKTAKIAIEPVSPGAVGAFPVLERRGSYEIQAASFCRKYRIRIRVTYKFDSPYITADRRLFLNLRQTTPVGRRRKGLSLD